MHSKSTASATLANGIISFAVANGTDRNLLLQRAGLDSALLEDRNNRIPLELYQALINAAQSLSDDPAIALKWAAAVDMADLSIVGLIMNASSTMGEAFVQLQRYGDLALEIDTGNEGARFVLQQDDQGLWMVDTRTDADNFHQLTEIAFARLTCGPRRFLDRPHILEVHFTHTNPGYTPQYDTVFGCPVTFESHWNALKLHPDIASWPVTAQPDYVFGILTEHADNMLSAYKGAKSTRGDVYRVLMSELHKGGSTADTVAAKLGLTRQTLYRRLKSEGTSFSQITEELRQTIAREYLGSKKATVSETAYLLGYSDPAAFSRAFKRWSGVSPKDY